MGRSQSHRRVIGRQLAVGVSLLVLGGAGIWAGVAAGASGGSRPEAVTTTTTGTSASCEPGWTPDQCNQLPTDREQVLSSYYAEPGASTTTPPVPPTDVTQPPPVLGIVHTVSASVPSSIANTTSVGYLRIADGVYQAVTAGASADDSSQGVVIVYSVEWNANTNEPLDGAVSHQQVFNTPTRDGEVTISSASANLVYLVAGDGTSFTFNLDTLEFA